MRGWRRRGEAGTRLPPLKRKLPAQSRAGRRAHACAHRCLRAVKTSKQGHPCIVSPSASLSAAVRGEGGGWGRLGEGQEVDDAREPADHPGPRVHRHHPNLHPRAALPNPAIFQPSPSVRAARRDGDPRIPSYLSAREEGGAHDVPLRDGASGPQADLAARTGLWLLLNQPWQDTAASARVTADRTRAAAQHGPPLVRKDVAPCRVC